MRFRDSSQVGDVVTQARLHPSFEMKMHVFADYEDMCLYMRICHINNGSILYVDP